MREHRHAYFVRVFGFPYAPGVGRPASPHRRHPPGSRLSLETREVPPRLGLRYTKPTRTRVRTHTHTHNTCTHVPTDIPHNHRQLHTHTTYLCLYIHHICILTRTYTLKCRHTGAYTHTCMRTHSQTCALTCMHTLRHAHMPSLTGVQSHRCTHACTRSPQPQGGRVGPLCSCCIPVTPEECR